MILSFSSFLFISYLILMDKIIGNCLLFSFPIDVKAEERKNVNHRHHGSIGCPIRRSHRHYSLPSDGQRNDHHVIFSSLLSNESNESNEMLAAYLPCPQRKSFSHQLNPIDFVPFLSRLADILETRERISVGFLFVAIRRNFERHA